MRSFSSRSQRQSDAQLVKRARGGAADAAEALLERHWDRAWTAAYAVLGNRSAADDAAQSAVERAFRALDSFDESRPFGPWLARIAANQALNQIRARRREVALDEELPGEDRYEGVDARDEVIRAVAALPPDRRMVVALRYWADLEHSEIALALDVPVGTVSSRLSRAIRELRIALEEVHHP